MTRLPWVVLVCGVPLLFPLQGAVDQARGPPPSVLETLPPTEILPVLAFGHRGVAADLLEIRATNFLIRRLDTFTRLDRGHLLQLYRAVMALDPDDPDACWRGSVYMSSLADRPDTALEVLEEGAERCDPRHERRWLLFYEMGAVNLVSLASRLEEGPERAALVRRAGQWWMEAATLPGANPILGTAGEGLFRRGLSPLEALEHEEAVWAERAAHGHEVLRRSAEQRLRETRCRIHREVLQQAAERFARRHGRPAADVAELEVGDEHRVDPFGVGYFLRDGQVIAPGYEAAMLRRELQGRFELWRRDQEGLPTLGELGLDVAHLRGYLRVEVREDGVHVEVTGRP